MQPTIVNSMVLATEPCPDCGSNRHRACNTDTPNPVNREKWHDHREDETHAPVGFSDPILGSKK